MFKECNVCNGYGFIMGDICCEDGGIYFCDECGETMLDDELQHAQRDDRHICCECEEFEE
jgi:hypothetical protein